MANIRPFVGAARKRGEGYEDRCTASTGDDWVRDTSPDADYMPYF